MKRTMLLATTVVMIVALTVGVSTAMAAKPDGSDPSKKNVVEWSNGFPSGPHMNLNIHGKNWDDCYAVWDPVDGWGNSIFVPEYTNDGVSILYKMNKKSGLSKLLVEEPCAFGGDSAIVRLPSGEYQVYARILAKPGKPGSLDPRSVVITPDPGLLDLCNLPEEYWDPDGTGEWDCETLMGVGVVTTGDAFKLTELGLERIAPLSTGGKGGKRNKAKPITDMFFWSGYYLVLEPWMDCYPAGDLPGDGQLTPEDLECALADPDLNDDLAVDEEDVDLFIRQYGIEVPETSPMWVFDLAELVTYGWDYDNSGAKLVQIRFYPVGETSFIPTE